MLGLNKISCLEFLPGSGHVTITYLHIKSIC
nr:MAG TPA: hypothetical protein [Siphoviridae sp. ctuK76]DAP03633.1 MAG TPA: hypothetical protein [Caudoviricetes sp.]